MAVRGVEAFQSNLADVHLVMMAVCLVFSGEWR
jgi:hypothetical protein